MRICADTKIFYDPHMQAQETPEISAATTTTEAEKVVEGTATEVAKEQGERMVRADKIFSRACSCSVCSPVPQKCP